MPKEALCIAQSRFVHIPEAKVREAGTKKLDLNHFINAQECKMELNVNKRW